MRDLTTHTSTELEAMAEYATADMAHDIRSELAARRATYATAADEAEAAGQDHQLREEAGA